MAGLIDAVTVIGLWWLYPLAGALAGLSAGLFGIGGGLIIVPAMAYLYARAGFDPAFIMHLAIATSLATIVFTSTSSTIAHAKRDAVLWSVVKMLVPGVLIGTAAGVALAASSSTAQLQTVFGVFVIVVSVYLFVDRRPPAQRDLPGPVLQTIVGAGTGVISALTGIGGGIVVNASLLMFRVPVRESVATAAATTVPVAFAAAIGFVYTGWHISTLPQWSTGFVYWPAVAGIVVASMLTAPLGAYLAHVLPTHVLKRLFAVVLAIVGARMLIGA